MSMPLSIGATSGSRPRLLPMVLLRRPTRIHTFILIRRIPMLLPAILVMGLLPVQAIRIVLPTTMLKQETIMRNQVSPQLKRKQVAVRTKRRISFLPFMPRR